MLPTGAKEPQRRQCAKRLFPRLSLWRFGSSLDLKRAHNPKVAGSNPAPATLENEGLADVEAANPFRLPFASRICFHVYGRVPVIVYVWFTQAGLRKLQSGPEHVNWNTPSHVVRSRKVPVSEYVTEGTTACTEKSPPPADPSPSPRSCRSRPLTRQAWAFARERRRPRRRLPLSAGPADRPFRARSTRCRCRRPSQPSPRPPRRARAAPSR